MELTSFIITMKLSMHLLMFPFSLFHHQCVFQESLLPQNLVEQVREAPTRKIELILNSNGQKVDLREYELRLSRPKGTPQPTMVPQWLDLCPRKLALVCELLDQRTYILLQEVSPRKKWGKQSSRICIESVMPEPSRASLMVDMFPKWPRNQPENESQENTTSAKSCF